jgi:hypothetical protein
MKKNPMINNKQNENVYNLLLLKKRRRKRRKRKKRRRKKKNQIDIRFLSFDLIK